MMSDPINLDDIDLESLKVVELKKKLKDLGLPVSGTKSELIERIHEFYLKGSMTGSSADALLQDGISVTDSMSDSLTNIEEFSFSSPEKEKDITPIFSSESTFPSTSVPLKKRAVVQASSGVAKVEKKIVLNRVSVPTPKFVPVIKSTEDSSIKEPQVPVESLKTTVIATDKDNPNSVIQLSTKNLSAIERLNLRNRKFKTDSSDEENITKPGKITISSNTTKTSAKSTVSTIATESNLNVLKKRAERFGENVSSLMKTLEDQQKIMKRKSKFGAVGNGVGSLDDQERKKKRAERFGL